MRLAGLDWGPSEQFVRCTPTGAGVLLGSTGDPQNNWVGARLPWHASYWAQLGGHRIIGLVHPYRGTRLTGLDWGPSEQLVMCTLTVACVLLGSTGDPQNNWVGARLPRHASYWAQLGGHRIIGLVHPYRGTRLTGLNWGPSEQLGLCTPTVACVLLGSTGDPQNN